MGLAAGAALVTQQAINARLRFNLHSAYWAAFFSYAGGTLAMLVVLVVVRERIPTAAQFGGAPWWTWIGGALGAIYVVGTILLVPRIGAAATVGLLVMGQMLLGLAFDQTGALGVPVHPTTPTRAIGVVLLILGTFLVRR